MRRNRGVSARGAVSKGLIVGGAVLLLALVVGGMLVGRYNTLVGFQEKTDATWGEVSNQYKRRADLIPSLVATVQGAADFEKSTITEVTEARARVGQAQLPEGEAPTDARQLEQYMQAQQGLGAALSRLLVVVERYPELKATQNFLSLQDQLEGTENRIAVARRDYIEAVREYNVNRRRFPTNIVAGLFGFDAVAQLQITPEEQQTPKVDFDFKK